VAALRKDQRQELLNLKRMVVDESGAFDEEDMSEAQLEATVSRLADERAVARKPPWRWRPLRLTDPPRFHFGPFLSTAACGSPGWGLDGRFG
jgi:hypothetical protein